jgi:hypothetical protein
MQGKAKTKEGYVYSKWDIICPTILIAIFGFCSYGGDNLFFVTMVVFFTIVMSYAMINRRSSMISQQIEQVKPRKEGSAEKKSAEQHLEKKESPDQIPQTQSYQRLGRDYVNRTILIGFDNISVAEACLEFSKKHGIKLHEPYDRLYAALNDPFWDKKTAERIFDFMNRIAPEGSELREINKNAWGFA